MRDLLQQFDVLEHVQFDFFQDAFDRVERDLCQRSACGRVDDRAEIRNEIGQQSVGF